MKRFITVMVCAVIALFYTDVVTAQTNASATVTANVLSTLQVTNLAGNQILDFGDVSPVSTETIPFSSGVDFRISGASNVPVVVTFTAPTELTGPGAPIGFTAEFEGSETNIIGSTSSVVSGAERTLNADGNHFLWLGGEITVGNVLPGTYSGTFTVTVAYP
ncbi:MAG: DUF4402 domain-containing protein [Rhodothermaceae bacterium]|nr:DUF4402 domain-containing protein [Rhodothermaceae bacterium]